MAASLASVAPTLLAPSATAAGCRHCGDPCPEGAGFCCAGCEAVYDLIHRHQLTDYYACEVTAGTSQRDVPRRSPDRFAVLDDPNVGPRFVAPANGSLQRATFTVPSMHCASCVWLLERLWKLDDGIGRSEVDVLTRTVQVHFDPRRTSLRSVAERLADLGYEPLLDPEREANVLPAERRALYTRLGVAGFAFGNVMLFSIPRYLNGAPLDPAFQRLFDLLNVALTLPVLLYSASGYLTGAWRSLRGRHVTIDVPVALGLVVLFGRSIADIAASRGPGFLDSFAGLVFFLLIGRLFQQKAFERIAFDRSARSFLPLAVYAERRGITTLTPIGDLRPGDVVALRPHEVVPADGTVLDDDALVNTAFITGEQEPAVLRAGARVYAGSRVAGRAVRVRVDTRASHARLAALWAAVPAARDGKPHVLDALASRFGVWFTTAAVLLAAAGAIVWWPDARMSVDVATAVLIIACPCALTLAAPIATGTAMTVLGRAGLYLKHPAVVMDLSRVDTIVLDKTGTLTTSSAARLPDGLAASQWALIRALAAHSVHPISRALAGSAVPGLSVRDVVEQPGAGVRGIVEGRRVVVGSAAFLSAETGHTVTGEPGATWASVDDQPPHAIRPTPDLRPGIASCVRTLGARYETWLLSGDHTPVSSSPWEALFGNRVRFRQSPEDKLCAVTTLRRAGRHVLMVGDGLNDAGALAAADVGLAVSDDTACLVPACDAVLRGHGVRDLPGLVGYARRTPRVIAFAFAVSVVYNVAGLALALSGALTPLATAILMPVSSMTIVAVSTGLMRLHPPAVAA